MDTEIEEIRIRKTENLSPQAQKEVQIKLMEQSETFNYRGYAKISYTRNSPLTAVSVDPIEGTIIDFFKKITPSVQE